MNTLPNTKDQLIAEIQAKKEQLNKLKSYEKEYENIKNTADYIFSRLAHEEISEPEIIQINNEIQQLEQKLKQHI